MESKSIECFLRVVELGSINKAAADLNVSQPSLSRAIAALEHEMGAQLFTRHQGGVQLTDPGRLLADRARPLLAQFALLKEQIGETSGQVAVGIPPSWQTVFTTGFIKQVFTQAPGVALRIHEGVSHVLLDHMQAGLLDLCIIPFGSTAMGGYSQGRLVREPLVLVGHPSSGVDWSKPVPLQALGGQKMVLPGKPNAIRQLIENTLVRQALAFKLVMQVDTLALCLNVASQNLAFTVVPACAVSSLAHGTDTRWTPIKGLYMTWALFENNARTHSLAVRESRRLLLEEVASSVRSGRWFGAESVMDQGQAVTAP